MKKINLDTKNNKETLLVLPINKLEDFPLNECLYSIAEQSVPVDVLVLVNGLNKDQVDHLEKIIESPKITISKKNEKGEITREEIVSKNDINYVIEITNSDTFQKVFNEAANYANINEYNFFSVIEYDDVLDNKWIEKVSLFANDKKDIDVFLPLTREMSNGVFLGFFNEASWVDGYAEEAGFFDHNLLLRFNCMNITGSVFKTKSLIEKSENKEGVYKPIKESMKIGYSYEFFLRMIYESLKMFTIPRIGYEHRIDRPCENVNYFSSKIPRDIISKDQTKGGITTEEHSFWLNLAKKEYFIETDRGITYKK
jgi:hypothetical protein